MCMLVWGEELDALSKSCNVCSSHITTVLQFILRLFTVRLFIHQDAASPRGTPLPSPRENGLEKARLLKKDPCSPASTASSASSSSLKSKELTVVKMFLMFQDIFG